MAYRFKVRIKEPGKRQRQGTVTADSTVALKRLCDVLLPSGSRVEILSKTKV